MKAVRLAVEPRPPAQIVVVVAAVLARSGSAARTRRAFGGHARPTGLQLALSCELRGGGGCALSAMGLLHVGFLPYGLAVAWDMHGS